MLLLFCQLLFFFFLLMFDVLLYYGFTYSKGAGKVSKRPKMITPIRLLLHPGITLEQLDRQLAFQKLHQFGYRYTRWNRKYKVNMINLHTHFMNLPFLPFTQKPYIFFNQGLNLTSQYTESIFWHPYNVIITCINNMRKLFFLPILQIQAKPKENYLRQKQCILKLN